MKKANKLLRFVITVVIISVSIININAEEVFRDFYSNEWVISRRFEDGILITEYDYTGNELMPLSSDYCPDDDTYGTVNGYFGVQGQSSTNNRVRNMSGGLSGSIEFFHWITGNSGLNFPVDTPLVIQYASVTLTWRRTSHSDGTPAVDINPKVSTYPYKQQKIHFIS